jgi:hypothetical protein
LAEARHASALPAALASPSAPLRTAMCQHSPPAGATWRCLRRTKFCSPDGRSGVTACTRQPCVPRQCHLSLSTWASAARMRYLVCGDALPGVV